MAQQEQNGSGPTPDAGAEPGAEERVERGRAAGGPEEFDEVVTVSTPGPATPPPSPREQWFGGFEGQAPPPPPYAHLPEDTPLPQPEHGGSPSVAGGGGGEEPEEGTSAPTDAPAASEGAGTAPAVPGGLHEPKEYESGGNRDASPGFDGPGAEAEAGGGTVRLAPGSSRGSSQRSERPQRQWLQRPTRPGGDPLAPRRLRRDPDVPEPEQLPPLETGREESAGPAPAGPGTGSGPGAGHGAPAGEDPPGPFRTAPAAWDRPRPTPPPVPEPPAELAGPRAAPAPTADAPESGGSAAFPPGSARTGGEPRVDQERPTSDSLNAATLVRNRRQGPSGGWRRAVHTATLGLVNPGESAKVLRQRELTARACTPVASGHHRVAVLSLKGGVGKTTTTVALGATLASLRGDRVLAVDANPDRGTLSDKVRLETAATIRDLLNERHLVSRYADIRGFTSQAPSRLEILASDRDPAVSEAFSDADYREVSRIVEHFYSICITDCGTGLLHSAMRGVLGLADQVVLVSSASVDGARSASATLDWLEAHGHGALVRGAVVVLSMVRSNSKSTVDLNRLEEHFADRCRGVVRVPWDGHLEEGAEVDLERLAPATRDAYLHLAATVGEAFAWRG